MAEPQTSLLWSELVGSLFARVDDEFLATFRAPGGANNRLAAWDPFDRTARYFKLLLFDLASAKPNEFFEMYQKLGEIGVGAPTSVTIRECHINIDYYLAVDEFLFLRDAIDIASIRSVVEIGAGFGRTAHALLLLADVSSYTIVDLPEVLNLSRQYLLRVLPSEHYRKIAFVNAHDVPAWRSVEADLSINIDSFQEMPPDTILDYSRNLIANSKYHYCKNPIAKYSPSSVGLRENNQRTLDVFALGLCRSVIDIFDDAALQAARHAYLKAYSPGSEWSIRFHRPLDIFPYLHHALFQKF